MTAHYVFVQVMITNAPWVFHTIWRFVRNFLSDELQVAMSN
jgi:hypothetical protein